AMFPRIPQGRAGLRGRPFLLRRGAAVHATDHAGHTPLHHAAWSGRTQVAAILLARGAPAAASTAAGLSPLHCAAANGHTLVAQLLRADANLADCFGCTALHKAATAGHLLSVRLLVEEGGSGVNSPDGLRLTPLHRAARCGHADVASYLLEHGAGVNAAGWLGKTPLHLAAEERHSVMVQLLLARGASPELRSWWKEPAEASALGAPGVDAMPGGPQTSPPRFSDASLPPHPLCFHTRALQAPKTLHKVCKEAVCVREHHRLELGHLSRSMIRAERGKHRRGRFWPDRGIFCLRGRLHHQ
uniref:Uncharacterized protein n=1 Tax=Varanus komodoensis TaxID=61221 RepID=A0A8D2LEM9_VARKO